MRNALTISVLHAARRDEQFRALAFDLMGVQRHLKAAGIFARLNHRDGKSAITFWMCRGTLSLHRRSWSGDIPNWAFLVDLINASACLPGMEVSAMIAMVLAAGRGERLRPLTDSTSPNRSLRY